MGSVASKAVTLKRLPPHSDRETFWTTERLLSAHHHYPELFEWTLVWSAYEERNDMLNGGTCCPDEYSFCGTFGMQWVPEWFIQRLEANHLLEMVYPVCHVYNDARHVIHHGFAPRLVWRLALFALDWTDMMRRRMLSFQWIHLHTARQLEVMQTELEETMLRCADNPRWVRRDTVERHEKQWLIEPLINPMMKAAVACLVFRDKIQRLLDSFQCVLEDDLVLVFRCEPREGESSLRHIYTLMSEVLRFCQQ
jgi:hypothetical protein